MNRKYRDVFCWLCPTKLSLDIARFTEKGTLCVPCTEREYGTV